MLRIKVIKGKKLKVDNIRTMDICTASDLQKRLTKTDLSVYGIKGYTEVYEIEGHTMVDIQAYKEEDGKGIHYLVAYHEVSKKISILKRANLKKCKKYQKKVERRQGIKSWIDTYVPAPAATITAISTLIMAITTIKNC